MANQHTINARATIIPPYYAIQKTKTIFHQSTCAHSSANSFRSNPVTCKDNCILLHSCLTNNPPRNFLLALKCAVGAKRPKSQPSGWIIWRFEVSGSGEGTENTCFSIKYSPSIYKTIQLSTLSLLIIPTTSQNQSTSQSENFFLKQEHHIFLIVNSISFAQEYLMLNC